MPEEPQEVSALDLLNQINKEPKEVSALDLLNSVEG